MEDDQHELPVESNTVHVHLNPYEVITLRLQTEDANRDNATQEDREQ